MDDWISLLYFVVRELLHGLETRSDIQHIANFANPVSWWRVGPFFNQTLEWVLCLPTISSIIPRIYTSFSHKRKPDKNRHEVVFYKMKKKQKKSCKFVFVSHLLLVHPSMIVAFNSIFYTVTILTDHIDG